MGKLIAPLGVLLGAAIWFLLFVIIGTGIVTAFIAGGSVVVAMWVAGAMLALGVLDAPLTSTGLLLGTATFVILEVVLSVPLWIDVVSGLGVTGLSSIVDTTLRAAGVISPRKPVVGLWHQPATATTHGASNGHDTTRREPIAAR
jgi:hypothetical protein